MALTFPQGIRVGNSDFIDDRLVFDTVTDALNNVSPFRRQDGLAIYIRELQRVYRFVDGITDDHFVPDPATGNTDSSEIGDVEEITKAVMEHPDFEAALQQAVASVLVWNIGT